MLAAAGMRVAVADIDGASAEAVAAELRDGGARTIAVAVDVADFASVNAIYGRYVTDPPPARSTVGIGSLPKGARIEIEAIARLA